MSDLAVTIGGWAVQVVTYVGAILAIYGWFYKPLKDVRADVSDIKRDTGDLLCDRLTQAHEYHMHRGYCPQGEKIRLCAMYTRYHALKRNTLIDTYVDDLVGLPEKEG